MVACPFAAEFQVISANPMASHYADRKALDTLVVAGKRR